MPSENVRQPCWSSSTSNTRFFSSTRAAPSEATVVVLATPPFWLATASVVVMSDIVPASYPSAYTSVGLGCFCHDETRAGHRSNRRNRQRLRHRVGQTWL